MPDNNSNIHQKRALELRLAQAKVVQESRQEQLRTATDAIAHYANAGADAAKRNEMIVASFADAANQYRVQLLNQAKLLGFADYIELEDINNNLVQEFRFRDSGPITTTQSLFLHQIAILNDMLKEVKGIQEQGLWTQGTLFKMLEMLNNLDNASKFVVEVGLYDPDSYRTFQILNHTAFANFTSVLWQNLVAEHNLDLSLEKLIASMVASIKPAEHGDAHSQQLTYDSFNELRDKFVKGATEWFVDNSSHIKVGSQKLAQHIMPVFLGVKIDRAELCKLNVLICELLDLEQKQNFTLTVEFFDSYLNVCFNKPEQQEEKDNLREKIADYIAFARELRDYKPNETEQEVASRHDIELAGLKSERANILRVIAKAKDLRREELNELQFLNKSEQDVLLDFLEQSAPKTSAEIISRLEESGAVTKEVLAMIKSVATDEQIKELSGTLSKMVLKKASFVDNPRVSFYSKLIKEAQDEIKKIDAGILRYADTINDHARSLLLVSDTDGSMLKDGDHFTIIFSRMMNPTEYALTKVMPLGIIHRLRIIDQLDNTIAKLEEFRKKYLSDMKEDSAENHNLRQAAGRIEDTIKSLETKRRKFENGSVLFTVKTLEELVAQQYKDHKSKNSELLAKNKISDSQRIQRRKVDKEVLSDLTQEIAGFKAFIEQEKFADMPAIEKIQKINVLIGRITAAQETTVQGNDRFDFGFILSDLERMVRFYSDDEVIKKSSLESDAEPEIKYVENEGLMAWFIEQVKFFVGAYNILKGVLDFIKNAFASIVNIVIFPFAETFKLISRFRSHNKELINQVKQLSDTIDSILDSGKFAQNKLKEEVDITEEDKLALKELKNRLAQLDDKVGRFSYSFEQVKGMAGYKGIKKDYKSLIGKQQVESVPEVVTDSISDSISEMSIDTLNLNPRNTSDSEQDSDPVSPVASSPLSTSSTGSSLARVSSVDSLESDEQDFFSQLIKEIRRLDDSYISVTIKDRAHKDFMEKFDSMVSYKKDRVLELMPKDLPISDPLMVTVNAELLRITSEITACKDKVNSGADELKKLDELLAQIDALGVRVARQVSPPSQAEALIIFSKKIISQLHDNSEIRPALIEAIQSGVIDLQSGATSLSAAGTVLNNIVKVVVSNLGKDEKLTDEQIASLNPSQTITLLSGRIGVDIFADPEVKDVLNIALGKSCSSLLQSAALGLQTVGTDTGVLTYARGAITGVNAFAAAEPSTAIKAGVAAAAAGTLVGLAGFGHGIAQATGVSRFCGWLRNSSTDKAVVPADKANQEDIAEYVPGMGGGLKPQ